MRAVYSHADTADAAAHTNNNNTFGGSSMACCSTINSSWGLGCGGGGLGVVDMALQTHDTATHPALDDGAALLDAAVFISDINVRMTNAAGRGRGGSRSSLVGSAFIVAAATAMLAAAA